MKSPLRVGEIRLRRVKYFPSENVKEDAPHLFRFALYRLVLRTLPKDCFPLQAKLGNHITHFNHFVLRTWEPPARVPNEKQSTGLFFSPPALLET